MTHMSASIISLSHVKKCTSSTSIAILVDNSMHGEHSFKQIWSGIISRLRSYLYRALCLGNQIKLVKQHICAKQHDIQHIIKSLVQQVEKHRQTMG